MITLKGKGVSSGVAFGVLSFFQTGNNTAAPTKTNDVSAELDRLEKAKSLAISQLSGLYEKAVLEVGANEAEIFEIHRMMLEDEDFLDSIRCAIEDGSFNAEYAVQAASDEFSQMFAQMEDLYMQARAADVRDISERLICALSGAVEDFVDFSEPSILAAEDLTPSQTLQMDKTYITAFVTVGGSQNSHTAILARSMNLPAVVGVTELMRAKYGGVNAIVDGDAGFVFLDPDSDTIEIYKNKLTDIQKRKRLLKTMKGLETITRSGKKVNLYANVGGVADVDAALQNDAEGIGLFRSEFIFLERDNFPTEDEQFEIYRLVVEKMKGKSIIIRTLDIGADKQTPYLRLPAEDNPALGLRGIRICLTMPELFKTQLRAIFRASAFGKIAIMFPMIISVDEILEIKSIIKEVKQELDADGVAYNRTIELGVMIETPAAAVISRDLAAEVDFFSIGTNDLTQYTLAIDRQNRQLEHFYNPRHRAILELIRMVVNNAHRQGIWVGICGELAADTTLTETFLEMGIDELSVAPPSILELRSIIRDML